VSWIQWERIELKQRSGLDAFEQIMKFWADLKNGEDNDNGNNDEQEEGRGDRKRKQTNNNERPF
jgi:hypothetical protein